jgi:DNA-binding response OmpR family regulator
MSTGTGISYDRRSVVRILVADGDDATRSTYRQSLTLAGCEVVDAADGRDALIKALSHRPTLVVTEARLPIFDGYALCQVLRRDSVTHGVPILMVTAETRPSELDRAFIAGADVVLTKPVAPAALLEEIHRLLRPAERANEVSAAVIRPTPPSDSRRMALSKDHRRFETTTPPAQPPVLVCPTCGTRLAYECSHIGGVSSRHAEQWDDYTCPASCGTFVYRHRTRKVRLAG